MYPKPIQEIIEYFQRFLPGVGPRQATRFVFSLLRRDPDGIARLGKAITLLPQRVSRCRQCFCFIESEHELCDICRNPKRDQKIILVVEKQADLEAIETTGAFDGTYHVLDETLPILERKESRPANALHVEELKRRIMQVQAKEVIIALSFTPEGETTRLFLKQELSRPELKITYLGKGLATGGEIEYADQETLASALERRS